MFRTALKKNGGGLKPHVIYTMVAYRAQKLVVRARMCEDRMLDVIYIQQCSTASVGVVLYWIL